MLASVHASPLVLPGHTVTPVVSPEDLRAVGPGDIVIWGQPAHEALVPALLEGTGAVVLALEPDAVRGARQSGLAAFLVPDLSPDVLLRALELDSLAAVEEGTLLWSPPTLWTPGRATPLPPHEAAVLEALLEGPSDRERLHERLGIGKDPGSRAADALIARLRRRLGRKHVVRARGGGWQLVLPSQARPAPLAQGPAPLDLGPVRVDLGQRLAWDGQRQVALTRLDVALLGELVREPGPVEREVLARAAWGRPVDRESIDLAMHRLRRKLGHDLVLTIRGHGYQLRRPSGPPPPPDLADALVALLAQPQLVALTGPPGVGKSGVAARVAERLRCPLLDLHDIGASQIPFPAGPGPLVLDGLEGPHTLPKDRPVLVTSRTPPALAQHVLRMEPWSEERLARAFPSASAHEIAQADGLPGALVDREGLFASLPAAARAALAPLAWFSGPFSREDAEGLLEPGLGLDVLLSMSLLQPQGRHFRLLGPLRQAPEGGLRWARSRVERASALLEARPFEPGPLQDGLQDLARACELLLEHQPAEAARAVLLWLEASALLGGGDARARSWASPRTPSPVLRAELVLAGAKALQREGEIDAALVAYTEAAHTGALATSIRAWLGAASVLAEDERQEEAWAALELAERLLHALEDPLCRVGALQRRSELYTRSGKPEQAVACAVEGLLLLEQQRWTAGSALEADSWRALLAEADLRDALAAALDRQQRLPAAAAARRRALDLRARLTPSRG